MVETLGPLSDEAHSLIAEIDRKATLCTADPQETTSMYQRNSVAIQRFNAVCLANTFTVSESPSSPFRTYIFTFANIKTLGMKYQGKKIIITTTTTTTTTAAATTTMETMCVHVVITAMVQPVHLITVEQCQLVADRQTKATDYGCESVYTHHRNLLLLLTPSQCLFS